MTEPYDNLLIISERQHLIPQRHCSKFAYVKHLGLVYWPLSLNWMLVKSLISLLFKVTIYLFFILNATPDHTCEGIFNFVETSFLSIGHREKKRGEKEAISLSYNGQPASLRIWEDVTHLLLFNPFHMVWWSNKSNASYINRLLNVLRIAFTRWNEN